jgi:ubiquinone/menaquinone biosynthesis C-methylase UbiE
MAGDYDRYSHYMKTGAVDFYDRLSIPPGAHLLDVGCGSGTLPLLAARNGAVAAGVDIAPNWLERARCRAASDHLKVDFREGDAESLPFTDAQFDFVTTMFGGMFAPQPDLVAAEMARVCKPGGTIAMSNWTPGGFAGQMYRIIARYVPTPMQISPFQWGDETVARQRLQPFVSSIRVTKRTYIFEYPYPPASVVEFFRENYGPVVAAFGHLDCTGRRALRAELDALWTKWNTCPNGSTSVPSDALEIIATRA